MHHVLPYEAPTPTRAASPRIFNLNVGLWLAIVITFSIASTMVFTQLVEIEKRIELSERV